VSGRTALRLQVRPDTKARYKLRVRMSPEQLRDDDPDIAIFRVLRDDGSADPARDPLLPGETLLRAHREMRRLRALDARMVALEKQGRIDSYEAAPGQEAVPVAAGLVVEERDWVFPAPRAEGVMLVRGFPLATFVAQVFGNSGDVLKGRQTPGHPSGRAVHQVSWSPCVGSQLPHAVGAARAMRVRGTGAVAVGFLGDEDTSQPDFHAAMNFAGVWKAPCVLVCQSEPTSAHALKQSASRTLAVKARAYGIPGERVDGQDWLAVAAVLRSALERARSGGGPTLVEAVMHKMDASTPGGDPIVRLRAHLLALGLVPATDDGALETEIAAEIEAAIEATEKLPLPARRSMFDDVYAEMPWHLREQLG